MLEAHILKKQGFKQYQIANMLGVTDRTVRNYLSNEPAPRAKTKRKSRLDPFKSVIDSVIQNDPFYNCILLFKRLEVLGYQGKISILRDYVAKVRKKVIAEAVIRYETEPAQQAQVDWKEFRVPTTTGKSLKRYAFVMTLGFSRKSFVCFTTTMRQSVLHDCHVKAFGYFGGVPSEILYDNMKTAFVMNTDGMFYPNPALLGLANHYGFTPKRCMIRRPQTKGKVERFIGYLAGNFWPGLDYSDLSIDYLNEAVLRWLSEIDHNQIKELGESRAFRFEQEKPFLTPLAQVDYDSRDIYTVQVSRESFITFETNRYSVPPKYIGESLTLKVAYNQRQAELFNEGQSIRRFMLCESGEKRKLYLGDDRVQIKRMWEKQRAKSSRKKIFSPPVEVEIRNPAFYDTLLNGEVVICQN